MVKIRSKQASVFSSSPYLDKRFLRQRPERTAKLFGLDYKPAKLKHYSTSVTPFVKKFASRFGISASGVEEMLLKIKSSVQFVDAPVDVAQNHYGLQTAHDILKTGKIPVPMKENRPQWGCNALCTVVASCLKANGIPYRFVRTVSFWDVAPRGRSHSVIMYRIGKRTFVADPFREKQFIQEVNQPLYNQIISLREKKLWHEGANSEELGIYSFADFNSHKRKRS